ncbi:unnamed protein product [Prunus armeniaca]
MPPHMMSMAPEHASIETLGRVQLGSLQFSPTDPSSQADLNRKVDELTKRFKDQKNLVGRLLRQIDLIHDFGLGLVGEKKMMDKRTSRQLERSQGDHT